MAKIQINTSTPGGPMQLLVNGTDLSCDAFRDLELVDASGVVGLRVTLAVETLGIDTDAEIPLTDHFPAAAARVRSIVEDMA